MCKDRSKCEIMYLCMYDIIIISILCKKLLSRTSCFRRQVKPLVPAAFAVVSTHQFALGSRGGLWPVLLMCNPKGRPVPQQWGH
jgi:hypothetical protein